MSADPMRYWQDTDDPNWSDEKEAAFITELSRFSIEHSMRPRDDFDVDVDPDSFRGKVLDLYDAVDALRATRRGRFLWWLSRAASLVDAALRRKAG